MQIDPAMAYVAVRSDLVLSVMLMKMPDGSDATQYQELRTKALAEARAKYTKKLAEYEAAQQAYEAAVKRKDTTVTAPEKPAEPTEANFVFPTFGQMAQVGIGPFDRFAKPKGESTYLQALTPGRYRIYGPIMVGANGAMAGRCFCMGSVGFEVKAGEITDLGLIHYRPRQPVTNALNPATKVSPLVHVAYVGFDIEPANPALSVDPRLKKFTIRPARYFAVGKLANYFGLGIDRVPAMPGVIGYDRDRILDLSTPN